MHKLIPFAAVILNALSLWAQENAGPEKIDLDKLIVIKKGTIPVIISAPHGGRTPIPGVPVRQGVGIDKFVIGMDTDTDILADKLALAIKKEMGGEPYVVIAHFQRKCADANRPPDRPTNRTKPSRCTMPTTRR